MEFRGAMNWTHAVVLSLLLHTLALAPRVFHFSSLGNAPRRASAPDFLIHLSSPQAPAGRTVPGEKPTLNQKEAALSPPASTSSENPKGDTAEGISFWIIGKQKPDYPAISRRLGEEGTVILNAEIDGTGTILRTELVKSSGFPRLDRAAAEYLNSIRIGFPRPMEGTTIKSFSLAFRLNL